MSESTHRAYIALGANLGDRLSTLIQAVEKLGQFGTIETVSSVYETEPAGYLDQPCFLNAVAVLRTLLGPVPLMNSLLGVETNLGRTRSFRNAPRAIDLDLLIYDDLQFDTATLILPHPRLGERAFVLVPLAEIAPDLRIPGLEETPEAILERIGTTGIAKAEPAETLLRSV